MLTPGLVSVYNTQESISTASSTDSRSHASTRSRSSVFLNFSAESGQHLPVPSRLSTLSFSTAIAAGFLPPDSLEYNIPSWDDVESPSSISSHSLENQPHNTHSGHLIAKVPGYHYEFSSSTTPSSSSTTTATINSPSSSSSFPSAFPFAFPEYETSAYESIFHLRHPRIFFGLRLDSPDDLVESPVIVILEHPTEPGTDLRRLLLFCCFGELRTAVSSDASSAEALATLEREYPELLRGALSWREVPAGQTVVRASATARQRSVDLDCALADYERKQRAMLAAFKVGVVMTRPGDAAGGSCEQAVYGHGEASEAFREFLGVLGEEVALRGYQGFRGGLDAEQDRTGTRAVVARWRSQAREYELMFHVATLLPHSEDDEQQLAKKRHIGNDVVVVVFHEDERPFDPSAFVSQFNHIFVVVAKAGQQDGSALPLYRIAVASKGTTPPTLPALSQETYVGDATFASMLHAKIINSEATALHYNPSFTIRNARARTLLLKDIVNSYYLPSEE